MVDKDKDWTSFDVVNKVRYTLKHHLKKKIKVGHAGTLDPLATGLLIICYGKMTKEIHRFQDMPKEYTGTIKLGATRPSFDMETEIDKEFPIDHISQEKVNEVIESFIGKQMQRAPNFSAKRVEGKRAYEMARKGLEVDIKENEIEIFDFRGDFNGKDEVSFKVNCSKGTYIRSLAHDVGKALNSGAYLSSLRRTKIGDYDVENARSIQKLEEVIESDGI